MKQIKRHIGAFDRIYDRLKLSQPQLIHAWDPNASGVPCSAVYIIHLRDSSRARKLARKFGMPDADAYQMIYVGRSGQLPVRGRRLRSSLRPDCSPLAHDVGYKLRVRLRLYSQVLLRQLVICVIPSSAPRKDEARLLAGYKRQFGRLPALNSIG